MESALPPTSDRFSFASPRRFFWCVIVLACGQPPSTAHAHGDLEARIEAVSAELAVAPSAALYLKRGTLHLEHEDTDPALADFDRAEKLDAALDALWLARGRTLLKAGRLPAARAALDRYLEKKPAHADAFLIRGRILSQLGHYEEAVADFNRNLALTPQPRPDTFLERASALIGTKNRRGALDSLDEAMRRLGNLVALQNAAIALELELGQPAGALARVDQVLAGLERKESWLARRGEILELAGRPVEARAAYQQALMCVEQLPAHQREARSIRDLQARLRLKVGA